ncbi:MAG: PatB family C-S lyase [Glaciecola sp.]
MFDNPPKRNGTYSFKWEKYKGRDILPVWIADTEFACASPISEALKQRVDNAALGYTLPTHYEPANNAVVQWCLQEYNWDIDPSWIVWTPGVVPAFNMACKAFCEPGDAVMVQTPNYPPLLAAPKINDLEKIAIPTVLVNERYTLDFDELEKQAQQPKCKLFIMCNPMNPVGSVMSAEELDRIADICKRNNVMLCSDEIHCDLILNGAQHIPAGKIDGMQERSVTLMAASKTFNVAGLGTSFAIIPNRKVRNQFTQAGAGIVPWANVLGLVATEVAFTQCKSWHTQQLNYLRNNRDFLVSAVNSIPGLSTQTPDATYLLWVDASGLNVNDTQQWCESKGVGPSPGKDFGKPECFRINYGSSLEFLKEVVSRLGA